MASTSASSPMADDLTDDIYSTPPTADSARPLSSGSLHAKRKLSIEPGETLVPDKKPKSSRLPRGIGLDPEIWQRIFCLASPDDLARLRLVNRTFNACLTDSELVPQTSSSAGLCERLHHEEIWQASRKIHNPDLPLTRAPCPEHELWRLLKKSACQFCGKQYQPPAAPRAPWLAGPGNDGVRIVWTMGVMSCGPCLRERLTPADRLMQSLDAYYLPTLDFINLTTSNNVITVSALLKGVHVPTEEGKRKMVWTFCFEAAKLAGSMPKHIYDDKKKRMLAKLDRAQVWEDWELSGGMVPVLKRRPSPEIQNPRPQQPIRARVRASRADADFASAATPPSLNPEDSPLSPTSERLAQVKFQRRREIQRRCSELEPPISPDLLSHMSSFHVAMQICRPLDDGAWRVLKGLLCGQRDEAQRSLDQAEMQKARRNAKSQQDKELLERFEALQAPTREKLSRYVQDFWSYYWAAPDAISWRSAPDFAAKALLYVHSRFVHENPKAAALRLDDMRWAFENEVKHFTDSLREDLFVCRVCNNPRTLLTFHDLMQHYAASHPNDFSDARGTILWHAAFWPEEPPFACRKMPGNSSQFHHPSSSGAPTGFPPRPPPPPPPPLTFPVGPQSGFTPGLAAAQQPGPNPANGYFASHGPYAAGRRSRNAPHPTYTPQAASHYPEYYGLYSTSPPAFQPTPYGSQGGYRQPPSPAFSSQSGFATPGPYPSVSPQTPVGGWNASPFHSSQATYTPSQAPSPAQGGTFAQAQTDAVVKHSREIFDSLFIVKTMPPSVRLHCVIQYVVACFKRRFSNEPNFDLFFHCVKSHSHMDIIARTTGVACKECVVAQPSASGDRVLYSCSELLAHFKKAHLEKRSAQNSRRPDWKTDMIELPSDGNIARLRYAPGMDDEQRWFLNETFPMLSFMAPRSSMAPQTAPQAAAAYQESAADVHDARRRRVPNAHDRGSDGHGREAHSQRSEVNSSPSASTSSGSDYVAQSGRWSKAKRTSETTNVDDLGIQQMLQELSNNPALRGLAKP